MFGDLVNLNIFGFDLKQFRLPITFMRFLLGHTNASPIIRNSSKLHEEIISMQSAHRGYLLTDDSTFLQPYNTGLKTIPTRFNEQYQLIKESDLQYLKLDSIAKLHKQWTDYASSLITAKQESNKSLPNNYQ